MESSAKPLKTWRWSVLRLPGPQLKSRNPYLAAHEHVCSKVKAFYPHVIGKFASAGLRGRTLRPGTRAKQKSRGGKKKKKKKKSTHSNSVPRIMVTFSPEWLLRKRRRKRWLAPDCREPSMLAGLLVGDRLRSSGWRGPTQIWSRRA